MVFLKHRVGSGPAQTMKLFKLLAFGLRSGVSFLAGCLWSGWACAIAKIHCGFGHGLSAEEGAGQRAAHIVFYHRLWAALGWCCAMDTLEPELGSGCDYHMLEPLFACGF